MFQNFENRTRPEDGPPRLARLRKELKREGLAGFLVPRADAHQGEYVALRDERLGWLTGFTGSAGFCAALIDRAGVFIDGRYKVQVKEQVSLDHFTPINWPGTKLAEWLRQELPGGGKIAFDPWLHSWQEIDRLKADLADSKITVAPTDNLIDRIWDGQPAPPTGKISVYPSEYAGKTHAEKRSDIAEALRDAGESAAILTLPDSIAWLLNIRGSDVAHTPIAHAFAILHDDARVSLFVAPQKIDDELRAHLGPDVTVTAPDDFLAAIASLDGKIRLDKASVPVAVADCVTAPVFGTDPCALPKACKNAAEIDGAKAAHLRDGAVMVEFLSWLDAELPKGALTEIAVAKALEGFRRATNLLVEISFDTISATGPHAALPHYRVTEDSDLPIEDGQLLLVDSGGQYLDGTTDITRTVAVGTVGEEEKACFTRVLQGMIAMSRARWPRGFAGRDLDAIARMPLWLAGQDYDHGTGHGVGAYLSVHEGPQRLSRVSDVPLAPGMILSNEPGYYREGAFGIRIENLLVVEEAPALPGGDDRDMLSFHTLAYAPIDRQLILTDLLSVPEREWVDAYHAETYKRLAPLVSEDARAWLKTTTAEL